MDRVAALARIEDLKKSIRDNSLQVFKLSIALDLFDAGLNKSLKIKSELCLMEYYSRDHLAFDLDANKRRIIVLMRRLQIAEKQLSVINLKDSIKSGPKKV